MYRGLAFRLFFSRVLLRFLLRSIVPLPAKGNFVAVAAVDVQLYCEHDRVVTVCGRNFVVLLGLPRQSLALAPNGSACKSISLRSISSGLCMSLWGETGIIKVVGVPGVCWYVQTGTTGSIQDTGIIVYVRIVVLE